MAEDDFRKRRQREDALEREHAREAEDRARDAEGDRLRAAFGEVESMFDQLNSLYNQFVLGLEWKPPIEKRRKLDRLMAELSRTPKPTQTLMFRWGTVQSAYTSHKERWDRQVKGIESGKIKRLVKRGPRAG
jgi:hypothetical protein